MCDLTAADTNSIAKAICDHEHIQNFQVEVVGTNKKGEGYLGDIEFVKITDKNSKRKLNIVLKRAFQTEEMRKDMPIRESFMNEIFMYTNILPKFEQFQKEIGLKNIFSKTAHCYAVSRIELRELLALENMKEKGFELFDKTKILGPDYMELIFKEYGRFHGLSYVYKEKYSEEFENFHNSLHNIMKDFMDKKMFIDMIELAGSLGYDSLIPGVDDKILDKYQKYKKDPVPIFSQSCNYEGKWGAILHGDCWSNNMMFKHDAKGKPVDLVLLDLQLSKLGTPVYDLSYCLYSGADKTIFDNLDKYLKIYYKSLTDFLKECKYKSQIFTFEELKEEWKQYCIFGFVMGLMLIRLKLQDEDEIKDLKDEQDFANHLKNSKCDKDTVMKRMRELIQHIYEIDAL